MILRRATEKDPKFKIRRRKNIKIKRGVKRRTSDGVLANDNAYIQFRYLAMLVDQELSNLKYIKT